jgi:hypothetical protein
MGFKIQRVRYHEENKLAVEVCNGTKHISKDVLATKYKEHLESKYLVSPVDAINAALRIYKAWQHSTADEIKKISLVNFDGKGGKVYFDPSDKKDIARLEKLAKQTYEAMDKCGHCKNPIGNKDLYEMDELPNKVFCTERCISEVYRHLFGQEPPKINPKTKKKQLLFGKAKP